MTVFIDSRLYGLPSDSALSNASIMGFAKASPTMTILFAFLFSTSLSSPSGSNPRLGKVTTVPPTR